MTILFSLDERLEVRRWFHFRTMRVVNREVRIVIARDHHTIGESRSMVKADIIGSWETKMFPGRMSRTFIGHMLTMSGVCWVD